MEILIKIRVEVLYQHHMKQTLERGTLPGIKKDMAGGARTSKIRTRFWTNLQLSLEFLASL